jgi:hypothetical protein
MRRALPILLALLAGCAFDVHGLTAIPCAENGDCPPDQSCSEQKCVARTCTREIDCGTSREFSCQAGVCVAAACQGDEDCGDGFMCGVDGYCWVRTCVPSPEGPPGSASCSDGIDNDCDGKTDMDDPGCHACEQDDDCDDGKPCNGTERCVDFACVGGAAVVCTPSATPCRTSVCDDTVTEGNPCILLPLDDGTQCDDRDPCTVDDQCTSGTCAGIAKDCADGFTCTVDHCDPADGTCVHTPNDGSCGTGQVCKPACFATASGCGVPPTSVSLSCTTPTPAATGTSCTVDLAGVSGQAACVECVARSSVSVPVYSDFDNGFGGCALDGWSFAATSPCNDGNYAWCVTGFAGTPALQVDAQDCSGKTAILERTVDTTGFQRVEVCFNYADRGAAGGNDPLTVAYDPSGTGASLTQLFSDVDGPIPGLDDTWLRYCIELPSDAVGRAGLLLRVSMTSNDAGQKLFADRLSVIGYRTACALTNAPFVSAFTGCATSGWTVASGTLQCPGFKGDALEANGPTKSWTLERSVDTTLLTGDLVLRFDLAEDGTTADDAFALEINATGTWQTLFHQTGALRPDQGTTTFLVSLSALQPAALGNPSLKLRFTATSSAAGHKIDLDNVSLTAFTGTCSTDAVVVGAPSDQGSGKYSVTATAATPMPVEMVCGWGGESTLSDSVTVQLTP